MRIYEAEPDDVVTSQFRDPLLRHLTKRIGVAAQRFAPAATHPRVIDLGCGVGRTALALAQRGYQVDGIDPSERAVALARSTAARLGLARRASFEVGDATAEPPAEQAGRYDLAISSEVIEHVEDPARVAAYARALLRSGGVFIVTTPNDPAQWTEADSYAGHVRRFRRGEIAQALTGFEIIEIGTEGFPFQRIVMQSYDRLVARKRGHEFAQFGHSPSYRAYCTLMPLLLNIDHLLSGLGKGTNWLVAARRP